MINVIITVLHGKLWIQQHAMFTLIFKVLSNDTEPGRVHIILRPVYCRGRVSLGSINCFLSASLNTHPLREERGNEGADYIAKQ